jgi:hypothetical protein
MLDLYSRPRQRRRAGLAATLVAAVFMALSAGSALAAGGTATITGTVTAPSASDAAHVEVDLLDLAVDGVDSSPTLSVSGSTVTYTFHNEPAGTFLVAFEDTTTADGIVSEFYGGALTASDATPVTVGAGASLTLNPTALTAGGAMAGTITDQNPTTDFATSTIEACPTGADAPIGCHEATTISNTGAFTIMGLPTGAYKVLYEPEDHSTPAKPVLSAGGIEGSGLAWVAGTSVSSDVSAASVFQVTAGQSTAVNFVTPQAGSISGTVTVAGSTVDGSEVLLYSPSGTLETLADASDTNGTYTMAGVLPGTYKVQFAPPIGGLLEGNVASVFYGGQGDLAAAATLTVAPGQTVSNINANLVAGATISGKVTAAQGAAPLGGLTVDVVDAAGNEILGVLQQELDFEFGESEEGFEIPGLTTASDGTYVVRAIPPGTWYLRFNGGLAWNGSTYLPEYYGGKPSLAGATPITVGVGQKLTGINEALLQASPAAIGLPTESAGGLSGLAKGKVALKFTLAAGSGTAADLLSFSVKLPKGFSWDKKTLAKDLSAGTGIAFTDAIVSGRLVVTFAAGERAASLTIKAGGITVSKAVEEAAGGGPKPKPKKIKKGKKVITVKPKPRKDTIKTETISVSTLDTIGTVTPLTFMVKKPH